MRQKLFTVEDNFYLTGRGGTVVAGQLEQNSPSFKPGDEVVLIQPDGKETGAVINGIELPHPTDYENFDWSKIGVLFKGVTKEDVPIGTEVYLKAAG